MSVASGQKNNGTSVDVALGQPPDPLLWDAYVHAHKHGSIFHLTGWGRAVQSAYHYEALYLTARQGERIVGVLPLVDVRSPLLGRSLISTPFSVGGGPLADDDCALKALLSEAVSIGEEAGVKYLECRSNFAGGSDWIVKTGIYAEFKTTLPSSDDDHLNAIPRKRRAEIRKAIAAEQEGALTIRHDGRADEFYALYARSLRQLGTPIFPRSFLDGLISAFPNDIEIAVVSFEGAPVAALLSFYFGDVVLPYYVGARPAARRVRAYDYIYWSVMRRAAARECRTFDFGRSRIDSGSYRYKKLWGAEPAPLTYRAKLIASTEIANVNPNNPKFALFAKLWPLLPLAATKALGPLLAPNFP